MQVSQLLFTKIDLGLVLKYKISHNYSFYVMLFWVQSYDDFLRLSFYKLRHIFHFFAEFLFLYI